MSILCLVKTPSGIVLASDSRLVLRKSYPDKRVEMCALDWSQKVFVPGPPNTQFAVAFYGAANVGIRSLGDLIAEWARGVTTRQTVEALAHGLHAMLRTHDLGDVCLVAAGFDETNYFGRIFEIMPGGVTEKHTGQTGLTLGGQAGIAQAISQQLERQLELLPLQGAAELARFLIRSEIEAQSFNLAFAGVGGAVQRCVLERGRAARLV